MKHVEERISLLTKELASKRRGTNWSSNLTLIVGLAALILLCGYFGYGYYELNDATKPENVLGFAQAYMEDYSEEARKIAAKEVRNSAPVWAEEVSSQFVANMPSFREQAEVAIKDYFDEQIEMNQELVGKEFETIVSNHRDDFKEAIKIMIEEGNSDEFVEKVLPIIEKSSAIDLKDNSLAVLGGLKEINTRLDKLANEEDLNPLEEQQKHILGLTRLLRDQ